MIVGRMSYIFIFLLVAFVEAIESDLKELDPKVFESLDKTQLKFLQGSHSQDDIVMHYTLTRNVVEKTFASYGLFQLVGGQLQAQLLNTRGILTGVFHTIIRRKTMKKTLKLPIYASGRYIGKLHNASLTITLDLPKSPGAKMKLRSCHTDVMHLELELDAYNKDDDEALKGLKYWLRDAMSPGLSELFCDAMERVLMQGMESSVVRALLSRTCDILGPGRCPRPQPTPNKDSSLLPRLLKEGPNV